MFFKNKNESKSLDNINHIDFMNLDTSLTENMSFMFKYLGDEVSTPMRGHNSYGGGI